MPGIRIRLNTDRRADRRPVATEEDYGPAWNVVAELEHGRLTYGFDDDLAFVAERVTGPERDRLWDRFGPPT
jgi:hypothetical protein